MDKPEGKWYRAKPDTVMGRQETLDWFGELENETKSVKDEAERKGRADRLKKVMAAYTGEDQVVSSLDIARDMRTRPPVKLISSGLKKLDDILGGFKKTQLITVAAPTKNGKTVFCIELTSRLKDHNPLWIPFEEPAEELIQKFLDRKEEPPLFYTPEKITGSTLAWIEKKIIEAKVKYDSEIVFIDHLHFIVPFTSERQDLMIGQTMRDLKKLAKELDVVIFLIAHLKKTRLDVNPDLEDLRDSSFIAQESDTVIMLWRKTSRVNGEVVISDETNVSVQANRRTGKTGNVPLKYVNGRFYEIDRDKEADEELTNWIK